MFAQPIAPPEPDLIAAKLAPPPTVWPDAPKPVVKAKGAEAAKTDAAKLPAVKSAAAKTSAVKTVTAKPAKPKPKSKPPTRLLPSKPRRQTHVILRLYSPLKGTVRYAWRRPPVPSGGGAGC